MLLAYRISCLFLSCPPPLRSPLSSPCDFDDWLLPDGDFPEGAEDGGNIAEELDDIDAEIGGLQDDPDVEVESAEDDAARDLQNEGLEPVDDGVGAGVTSSVEKQLNSPTMRS